MQESQNEQLAGIAEKSIKETAYHLRWSAEWVIRLGDGTEESKQRVEAALADLWMFTGEMFEAEEYEPVDLAAIKAQWIEKIKEVFEEATITLPAATKWIQRGGKHGIHTEYMGYLLAEMQHLQRAYPNATW
jgi:ring-1,2-phenylacetyl-CoA epoxidase subunit PaaC